MSIKLNVRPGLGRKRRPAAQKTVTPAPITIPAQPSARDDHYTWAVNAAVESGQLDIVEDLAAAHSAKA